MRLLQKLLLSQVIFRPGIRELEYCAGHGDLFGCSQAIKENVPLQIEIIEIAKGVAERMLDIQSSGRLHHLGDLPDERERYGCQSGLIEHALDQSHGLIADRSGGRQEDQVGVISLEFFGDFRRSLVDQRVGHSQVAHEREVARSQRADDPFSL